MPEKNRMPYNSLQFVGKHDEEVFILFVSSSFIPIAKSQESITGGNQT
jgi:hypothetical protein